MLLSLVIKMSICSICSLLIITSKAHKMNENLLLVNYGQESPCKCVKVLTSSSINYTDIYIRVKLTLQRESSTPIVALTLKRIYWLDWKNHYGSSTSQWHSPNRFKSCLKIYCKINNNKQGGYVTKQKDRWISNWPPLICQSTTFECHRKQLFISATVHIILI